MEINDLRKIGKRLNLEILMHLEDPLGGCAIGKGAGGDITHSIDKRAEDIIIEELEKLNEPFTLISEECGYKDIQGGGPRILVDPIDGSRNALSGIPLFSTSIALINGDTLGNISMGYVINLTSGDEYWAIKGSGSFLNGVSITTQKDASCKVIAYEVRTIGTDIPRIIPLLSLFDRPRCFGSTALDMAFLASGALSMFIAPSPSRSFDFAAGCLLIKEAGGIITDLEGKEIDNVEIGIKRSIPLLASGNHELHRKALNILKQG